MSKVLIVAWNDAEHSPAELGRRLIGEAGDALAPHCERLWVAVADERADVPSPSPFPLFGRAPCALVSAHVGDDVDPRALSDLVAARGVRACAYLADESIYRDYGDNAHAAPRDWPDGQRSPGITAISFLFKPRRFSQEEWIARWHGRMSPVSEAIQPRARYVRNVITERLGQGPAFAGIVEECWPSPRHVTDPYLFYGAVDPDGTRSTTRLVRNMGRILGAVTHFTTIWRIQTVMASEVMLQTPMSQ